MDKINIDIIENMPPSAVECDRNRTFGVKKGSTAGTVLGQSRGAISVIKATRFPNTSTALKRKRQPPVVRSSPTRPYAQQLLDPAPAINDDASELASAIAAIPGAVERRIHHQCVETQTCDNTRSSETQTPQEPKTRTFATQTKPWVQTVPKKSVKRSQLFDPAIDGGVVCPSGVTNNQYTELRGLLGDIHIAVSALTTSLSTLGSDLSARHRSENKTSADVITTLLEAINALGVDLSASYMLRIKLLSM